MQGWIEFVPMEQLVDGETYFIGRHLNKGDAYHESCMLIGRGLNGKLCWTHKPGIAIRSVCNAEFRELLNKHPDWSVVRIPRDADKRWKARKRRFYRKTRDGLNY
jgi:hypothetical protein